MTISTIDPATPDPNGVAGLGDDEIRALKQALVDQFAGQAGDFYDIPITAGPRALNAVDDKADQADLDATQAQADSNTTQIGLNTAAIVDHEARIAAIEADYTTANQARANAWPVGSMFISADGGTPASKGLPGTWAVRADGRVLYGDPTTGQTGGNNDVTIQDNNIPPHKHQYASFREDSATNGNVPAVHRTNPNTTFSAIKAGRDASSEQYAIFNTDEGIGLSGDPVDVRQAYLTVRFYERTA